MEQPIEEALAGILIRLMSEERARDVLRREDRLDLIVAIRRTITNVAAEAPHG